MSSQEKTIVGGGPKKVLYTLNTVRRIGLLNSAKALKSNNTCKACGLGMGGQQGGMTNESGEFPSVCNKSIQAQSTDIQPPIPLEIFEHSLTDFKKLTAKELESLGRLSTPLYKSSNSSQLLPISWNEALNITIKKFQQSLPENTFFYSSGRSSNEAGFVLQLLARLYGTNNVNNCSYYCHQATSEGLHNSIGTGTATIELEDLDHCDCIFVIGANPASNHPRFIHKLKNCRERGGKIVIINPAKEPGLVKFAVPKSASSMLKGGSDIASEYLQPRIGSDIILLKGIAKAVIEAQAEDNKFIQQFTENFSDYLDDISTTNWETICELTGLSQQKITRAAQHYIDSKQAVFAWGMGITHHTHGVENVEAIANLALLRGMAGKRFAGLLPLRGHSNVQGIGTIGVKPVIAESVMEAMENHLRITLPRSKGLDTLACLQQASEGNMQAALMMGGNLFSATPNRQWAEQAFNRIPFKVYLTTTLNQGHVYGMDEGEAIILPVTARDEEWQATTQESMFNYVRLSDGGITRLEGPRPESHILCDIAKGLLKGCSIDFDNFKQHDTIREAIAVTIPGMEQLKDINIAKKEFHVQQRILHQPVFKTASGKAQFQIHPLNKITENTEYPFQLMSIRSEGQFNSIIYEEADSYRGTQERWSALLNAQDLLELGISSGEQINIRSPYGEMKKVKAYAFSLPKGNIAAYYPEANVLIGLESDPRSKTPAFKSVPVDISKA